MDGRRQKPLLKCHCNSCPDNYCYTDGVCFSQKSFNSKRQEIRVESCLNQSKIIIGESLFCHDLVDFSRLTDNNDGNHSEKQTTSTTTDQTMLISNSIPANSDSNHAYDNNQHSHKSKDRSSDNNNLNYINNANTTSKSLTQPPPIGLRLPPPYSTNQITKCCTGLDMCNQHLKLDLPNNSQDMISPIILIVCSMLAFVAMAIFVKAGFGRSRRPQRVVVKAPGVSPKSAHSMTETDNGSTTSREPLISFNRILPSNASVGSSLVQSDNQTGGDKRQQQQRQLNPGVNVYGSTQAYGGGAVGSSTFNGAVGKHRLLHDGIYDASSGSGAGTPLLTELSIAREISLLEPIGRGSSADVRKALWRGQFVAVKIFTSVDERSWFREVEFYQHPSMRHENILRFIAADNRDNSVYTELWLITDYHPLGSVYNFLSNGTIDLHGLIKLTYSMADAVSYLHAEIKGIPPKPAMAHRDLKSRNILVKVDGTCVLADFGLAVSYQTTGDFLNVPANPKEGTKRYMSPEVLLGTIDMKTFDSFTCADIYSLGLVIWEICRRTRAVGNTPSPRMVTPPTMSHVHQQSASATTSMSSPPLIVAHCETYELPYTEQLGSDPSFEAVRELVGVQGVRPHIPERWTSNNILAAMTKIMHECWYHNPKSRLTALRVKKSIMNIRAELMTG